MIEWLSFAKCQSGEMKVSHAVVFRESLTEQLIARMRRFLSMRCYLGEQEMPKILLIEDNEMNRDMLSRRLIRKGIEVVIAIDGEQGVALALTESPDLILMDMSLPVLDGWSATRQIKATLATQNIPVIALTAHAMAGDRDKCLEAGCDDYDTKPIEFTRLLGKIQALLVKEAAS
jgi:CheY-like chemotaxis protein